MITWPDEVVTDIARRKAVLVLGAGISMNAKTAEGMRPKSWVQLLQDGAKKIGSKPRKIVRRLLKERDFLTACEILKAELGKENYETFLTEEFLDPKFAPAAVHDAIFKLDSRIVATPNIDKIYEGRANHLGKGSVKIKYYYDDDIADAIRRTNRLILKVHGTIDTPAKMIFTRREYAVARAHHAEFYAILDALVITHTFIFLGCSVNDPDVRLLLENYAFRYKNSRRHYITLASDSLTPEELRALEDSTNLKVLPYKVRNKSHKDLIDSIQDLQTSVETRRTELASTQQW
jgi:SIR2-like domain